MFFLTTVIWGIFLPKQITVIDDNGVSNGQIDRAQAKVWVGTELMQRGYEGE